MVSPLEGVAYSLTAGVARGIFGRMVPIRQLLAASAPPLERSLSLCRECYRLLQTEFQQRLARHLHLLAFRQYLNACASRRAHARTDRRALAAAGNRSDDCASYRATADFFRGVRATALAFQAVVAADDRIVLAIDHHAGELKLQLTATGHVARFFGFGQPPVDIRPLARNHGIANGQVRFKAGVEDVADVIFGGVNTRSEEHTSELQSQSNLVCRL